MEEQLRRQREQTNVGSKVAKATSISISVQDLRGTIGIFAAATLVQASLAGGARGSIARIIVAIEWLKVVGAHGVNAHFAVKAGVLFLACRNSTFDAAFGAGGA